MEAKKRMDNSTSEKHYASNNILGLNNNLVRKSDTNSIDSVNTEADENDPLLNGERQKKDIGVLGLPLSQGASEKKGSLKDEYLNSDQFKEFDAKNRKENPPEKSTAKKVAQGISIAIAVIGTLFALITGMAFLVPLIYVSLVAFGIEIQHEENKEKYLKNAVGNFVKYAEEKGHYLTGKERGDFMREIAEKHKIPGETLDWVKKVLDGEHLMGLNIEAQEKNLNKGGINQQQGLNVNQHIDTPTAINGNNLYKQNLYTPEQILKNNKVDLEGAAKTAQKENINKKNHEERLARQRQQEQNERKEIITQ